jgi:hypothetical protein
MAFHLRNAHKIDTGRHAFLKSGALREEAIPPVIL